MNLLNELSLEDKNIITRYVEYYGGANGNFIGIDAWLDSWAKNKKKLYKLLGNNITHSFVVKGEEIKNNSFLVRQELNDLYDVSFYMKEDISNVLFKHCKEQNINRDIYYNFSYMFDRGPLLQNQTPKSLYIKFNNKTLDVKEGTPIIKAINKVLAWCEKINREPILSEKGIESKKEFEKEYSLFINAQKQRTNELTVTLSINPFDFITMSDNSYNWGSCMSWTNMGCFRLGTVEMMNSNVVLCAYLGGEKDFLFDSYLSKEKIKVKNSKKWRQLFIINKDIILGGKSYPQDYDFLTKSILDELKRLAKENFNWDYKFGIETYEDMFGVNSELGFERARELIAKGKKSILINTKAMYNDIFNDNREYYCYRNAPKKGYVLNISGKAHCICCNKQMNIEEENYYESYNDRYNANELICGDCYTKNVCICCGSGGPKNRFEKKELYSISLKPYKEKKTYCEKCLTLEFKKCGCCNRIFYDWQIVREVIASANGLSKEKIMQMCPSSDDQENFFNVRETFNPYSKQSYFRIKNICPTCLQGKGYTIKKAEGYYWYRNNLIVEESFTEKDFAKFGITDFSTLEKNKPFLEDYENTNYVVDSLDMERKVIPLIRLDRPMPKNYNITINDDIVF